MTLEKIQNMKHCWDIKIVRKKISFKKIQIILHCGYIKIVR